MAINLDKNGTRIEANQSIGLSPPPLITVHFMWQKKAWKSKAGTGWSHGVDSFLTEQRSWRVFTGSQVLWIELHDQLLRLLGPYIHLVVAGDAWMPTRHQRTWLGVINASQSIIASIPGLHRTWRLMSPFRLGRSNKSAIVLRARYDFSFLYLFEGLESVFISASLGTLSFN